MSNEKDTAGECFSRCDLPARLFGFFADFGLFIEGAGAEFSDHFFQFFTVYGDVIAAIGVLSKFSVFTGEIT